jgi:hypothetical protein
VKDDDGRAAFPSAGFWYCGGRSDILSTKMENDTGREMLTRILQAGAILLAGTATPAAQTAYPSRPITMVVAFNADGSTDLIARVLAQRMGSLLGQTVIIDNNIEVN